MTEQAVVDQTPGTTNPRAADGHGAQHVWKAMALRVLWFPALLPWVLIAIYTIQPDALASWTMIPAFCWLLVGTQLLGPMLLVWRQRVFGAAALGWLLFAFFLVPEWRSLLRSRFNPPAIPEEAISLRVITTNTGAGKGDVLRALSKYKPDLILVQESPPAYLLPQLTSELWGPDSSTVSGFDCSIIARGRLTAVPVPSAARFNQAVWEPISGLKINVFSLRLTPVPVDMSFWDSTARSTYRQVRENHREEMRVLTGALDKIPTTGFTIIGGDFNCPAGDRIEWPLNRWGQDPFRVQGRGWGNTIFSIFPFHRIDRLRLSKRFRPVNVQAIRTRHSDHCFVICDFYVLPAVLPAAQPAQTVPASISSPNTMAGHGAGQ